MNWFKNLFGGSPSDPSSEMKRLAAMGDREVILEVEKARKRLLEDFELQMRPKLASTGQFGLANLGNTCFISATFQCLLHCPQLLKFFFETDWLASLNPLTSPFQGKLALKFYQLMCVYWERAGPGVLDPTEIHKTITKVNKELDDLAQHDAQEFLAFFLDSLHEDLNRVIVRRYEALPDWRGEKPEDFSRTLHQMFLRRNRSLIADLFYGQFCSQIECPSPECGHRSVSCEPFNVLSLDPPSTASVINFDFYFVPPTTDAEIEKLTLNCLDSEPMTNLLAHVDAQRPEFAAVGTKKLSYRSLELRDKNPDWQKLTTGSFYYSAATLVVVQVYHEPIWRCLFAQRPNSPETWGYLQLKVYNNRLADGIERLVAVPRNITRFEIELVVYLVHRRLLIDAQFFPKELASAPSPTTLEEVQLEFGALRSFAERMRLASPFEIRVMAGYRETMANINFFDLAQSDYVSVSAYFSLKELAGQALFRRIQIATLPDMTFEHSLVTVESCLERFTRREVLDQENMWFCSKCKEHKKASKVMLVSRLPPVLIIHLKRFKRIAPDQPTFRKFGDLISFPLEALNMAPCSLTPSAPILYDLFAVSNHVGNVWNGHYFAYCKNLKTGDWTCYDDRLVKWVNGTEVVTKNAYLLFYKLRG